MSGRGGSGGCERRIEVIVKMQKKVGAERGSSWWGERVGLRVEGMVGSKVTRGDNSGKT